MSRSGAKQDETQALSPTVRELWVRGVALCILAVLIGYLVRPIINTAISVCGPGCSSTELYWIYTIGRSAGVCVIVLAANLVLVQPARQRQRAKARQDRAF